MQMFLGVCHTFPGTHDKPPRTSVWEATKNWDIISFQCPSHGQVAVHRHDLTRHFTNSNRFILGDAI